MEAAVRHRRLPGVFFEAVPRPIRDPLPRMDVAAFVGFAAAGPVDVPVLIEDVRQFRDVFGPPLRLLRDDGEGRPVYAQLYPAVELFFRNGGRRCRVVRVARDPHVRTFRLPGVVDARRGLPVQVRARSGGTWADDVMAHTVLKRRGVVLNRFEGSNTRLTLHCTARPADFAAGDLLVLDAGRGVHAFATAEQLEETGESIVAVTGTPYWFSPAQLPAMEPVPVRVRIAMPGRTRSLPMAELVRMQDEQAGFTVRWSEGLARPPVPGDTIHATVIDPMNLYDGRTVWLAVSDVHATSSGVELTALDALWPVRPGATFVRNLARDSAGSERFAYILRFDLHASGEYVGRQRLVDLSFSNFDLARRPRTEPSPAERFWGGLPTDDELYGSRLTEPSQAASTLIADVRSPRFAFAAAAQEGRVFIPLGMPSVFRLDGGTPPDPLEGDARAQSLIVREGLEAPATDLFLDAEMRSRSSSTLEAHIFDRLYIRMQPLHGLHAVWPLEEVSLAAVPDAAHGGFEWVAGNLPVLLDAPELSDPVWIADAGTARLVWTLSNGKNVRFEVQQSAQADFSDTPVRYRTKDSQLELRIDGCSRHRYFRVRARRGTEIGPWSNTVQAFLPPVPFERCRATLAAPAIELTRDQATNTLFVRWDAVEFADDYEVVISSEVEMLAARINEGPREEHTSEGGGRYFVQEIGQFDGSAPLYVRVRALRNGEVGPWSRTLRIDPETRPSWRLRKDAAADQAELLSIHRALIRLCAVRADCFALLGLPKSFSHEEALDYVTALKRGDFGAADVPAIRPDEDRQFSFAAIFHPWAMASAGDAAVLDVGADGIAAGMYAFRTLRRGAWVAPAEIDLQGLLGVGARFTDGERIALREGHINTLIGGAGRFVVSGAQTLSTDPEWDQANVRRLMILLRRLLLREGNLFVFDSNDDALRRRIALRLEETFTDLFRRGAFAGRTAAEAFHIDTSRNLNTQDEIDRGRLLVEIRVAPSRPLVFLVIRLIQRELEGLRIAEA